jgi:transcriptional regulator with XRE-family HTH domain
MSIKDSSDTAIQSALGERLRSVRLDLNLTRENLAADVGLSVDTVRNAEMGRNVSIETLIRLLRGLGQLDDLAALLAVRGPSPVKLAERLGKIRQRASGSRSKDDSGRWQW